MQPHNVTPPRLDTLLRDNPRLLAALLKDHTMSRAAGEGQTRNIFWATHDYASLGPGYAYHDPITPASLYLPDGSPVVQPRVAKSAATQAARCRDRAEVFTPAWVCNAQNNLVDDAWFGRPGAFNTEHPDTHTWTPSPSPVAFPATRGRSWADYVRLPRLEITCGEAPYLASPYDATTGSPIPLACRVGLLDRKLRVVGEHYTGSPSSDPRTTPKQWSRYAKQAVKSCYGYDWQGDNVFLARKNLLQTYLDYYGQMWHRLPAEETLLDLAEVVAWNVWQMDGLKFIVPGTDEYCLIREWHPHYASRFKELQFNTLLDNGLF